MNHKQFKQIAIDLKRDEGERVYLYKCPAGKMTIGVGRNLEDNGLRPEEITILLKNDIDDAYNELSSAISLFTRLDEVRQNVLVNMCFNMGLPVLLGFKKCFRRFMRKIIKKPLAKCWIRGGLNKWESGLTD